MDDEYISAEEAAALLGVSVTTLYAYVSRKGLRSQPVPGSRSRRYWRDDVDRLRRKGRQPAFAPGELQRESRITLLTEHGPYYRGRSAAELAETWSIEAVAALLWDVEEDKAFTARAPRCSPRFAERDALLAGEAAVDRAVAHLPFLEHANAHAHDLTPIGMARSGADILRWLTAIFLRRPEPSVQPIHEQFGAALRLEPAVTDLVRRLLILGADHGFEEGTYAVRAVASTGVTPWRSVAAGLMIHAGRSSKFGHSLAARQFVAETIEAADPEEPIARRMREHEPLPGFESRLYAGGDPRARVLVDYCDAALGDDPAYARFRHALRYAEDVLDRQPAFSLLSAFVTARIGLAGDAALRGPSATQSPFLIGRAIGWIAHASEQYQLGEAGRREQVYKGPLPPVA